MDLDFIIPSVKYSASMTSNNTYWVECVFEVIGTFSQEMFKCGFVIQSNPKQS